MGRFEEKLERYAARFEAALSAALDAAVLGGPGSAPERLVAAMRHGSLGGGKRLRPFLVTAGAAVVGVGEPETLPAALAVEMVHCYSLIHDDLPAMDDDDLRRGRPTVHRAYDEATAILAGDALLTRAFALLAGPDAHADASVRAALVAELAAGAGAGGMVGGQMRDLQGENGSLAPAAIATMQAMKTGALIRAAVRMGAVLGHADADALAALTRYGEAAGRAFQLADDILDVTATEEAMGKATAKDLSRGKQTMVAALGVDAALRQLGDTVHDAITALTPFGEEADPLREAARFLAERRR